MGKRKLFCEISPLTYQISVLKCCSFRHVQNILFSSSIAKQKSSLSLPVLVYKHNSLIRRKLGNADLQLQDNKAVNLQLAAPKVSGIIINPGEVFSFWQLVGKCTAKKGYLEGLTISKGSVSKDIGGGMCQLTNLLHWMVLHTPLTVVEHHHHDRFDLFPDYGRKVPFGTGTSILYNYLDYRFKNNTTQPYQLIVYTTEEYLCGEIRTTHPLEVKYHIKLEDEQFIQKDDGVYRTGKVFRECVDKATGNTVAKDLIKTNNAKVMYDTSSL